MWFPKIDSRLCVMIALSGLIGACTKSEPEPSGPTFRGDVAKIVHENCSYCHRPGQTAPFNLLTYQDVSQRARQIVEVTESRYMPPWLPGPGYNQFQNERSLTQAQIDTIRTWVDAGAPEGDSLAMPVVPDFSNDWYLGEPDLVVQMPEPFDIPAEGPDVYQNFVVPIPTDQVRYVRAMEFRPGNPRVVHHAFLAIDSTTESKRTDDNEPGPGFVGMHRPISAEVPDGQFFSWQPGKVPIGGAPERSWELNTNSWLVLQLHLQTTGKKESVQSAVGFYFSEEPGTDVTFKLALTSYNLNIPPGATNFVAEDVFTLPVDVELIGILPHAHYLAHKMHGMATLPDGSNRWLLNIPQWDFNWQGEYWYEEPIKLPKGTRVGMRFFYDNSSQNLSNPSDPPQAVSYGLQSVDEMAELWMMFRLQSEQDRMIMNRAVLPKTAREVIVYNQALLQKEPTNANAWLRKATGHLSLKEKEAAYQDFKTALRFNPQLDEAHYFLGLIAFDIGNLDAALNEFDAAIQINRNNYKAYGYRGLIFTRRENFSEAEYSFKEALRANPEDAVARSNLERLEKIRKARFADPPTL